MSRFDVDSDGMVTERDLALKEKIQQMRIVNERFEVSQKMGWISLLSMLATIGYTLVGPIDNERLMVIGSLIEMYFIISGGIVATLMGTTAWVARGNK